MRIRPLASGETQFLTYVPTPRFKSHIKESVACFGCDVETIYKLPGKFFGYCQACGLKVMFFMPYEAQQLAHTLQNRTVLMFSGVSSGKTTMNGWSIIEHALTIPNAAIYVMAQTSQQRDKNVKDQVLRQFIDEKRDLKKHNQEQWTFHNGSTIYFYTSDDHQKLKSANATCVWLVEAQGFKVELYFESQQRARALAAKTFKKNAKGDVIHIEDKSTKRLIPIILEDRALILVEGNIDPNSWIREYGVLQAHTIIGTPNTFHYKLRLFANPVVDKTTGQVKDVVAIIMSPFDNYYNSLSFLSELKTGKPKSWVNQEVYGDLSLESGLIFPEAKSAFVNTAYLQVYNDDNWQWIEGMDFGGVNSNNDPTAYILGRWNPDTNEMVLVAEYCKRGTLPLEDVRAIQSIRRDWNYDINRSAFFVCDPSGRQSIKTDYDRKDLITHYQEAGLVNMEPAFRSKGANTMSNILVRSGITKINSHIANGDLKIDRSLNHLSKEMSNYRFKTLTLAQQLEKTSSVKTLGADHVIDALRYIVMTIPYASETNQLTKRRNKLARESKKTGDEKYGYLKDILFSI